ncbi:MAG: chorismate-binding protein [Bacteroidales bacterium]
MSTVKSTESFAALIQVCIRKSIPFVCFRLPEQSGFQTWIIESGKIQMFEKIDEVFNKSGFVYAPFHRKTNFPVILLEPETIIHNFDMPSDLTERIELLNPLYPDFNQNPPEKTIKSVYLSQAMDFISRFDEKMIKAVLSRVEHVGIDETFNTGKFFITLQNTYPGAFCHLIHIPGTGTWCGATPEMLLRMDQKIIRTVSLAGTRNFHQTDHSLVWEPKELEEQNIVTNYILDCLKKFGISDYHIDPLQTVSAGLAVHLSTTISFKKSGLQEKLSAFIEELHPTPAVCGLPKEDALNLILDTEIHNREYYSGYCGLLHMHNKSDLFVNLRCMKVFKDKVALFIGGGLTKCSDPEREWEETRLKARTLSRIIDELI